MVDVVLSDTACGAGSTSQSADVNMVRYLTEEEVKRLISMPRALELFEDAWRARSLGQGCDCARTRIQTPEWMLNMLKASGRAVHQ